MLAIVMIKFGLTPSNVTQLFPPVSVTVLTPRFSVRHSQARHMQSTLRELLRAVCNTRIVSIVSCIHNRSCQNSESTLRVGMPHKEAQRKNRWKLKQLRDTGRGMATCVISAIQKQPLCSLLLPKTAALLH
jgi:hypothetical protein